MNAGQRSGNVIGGVVVIAVGLWFLLRNFGIDVPGIGNFWPIFPTLGGLGLIAQFTRGGERDAGVLIPGVSAFLIGLFFFFFTFGVLDWSAMGQLWPVFPLIGGISFVAAWLGSGMRDGGLLIPAGGGIAVGLIGLIFTTTGLDGSILGNIWPILLILVGVSMIGRNFLRR